MPTKCGGGYVSVDLSLLTEVSTYKLSVDVSAGSLDLIEAGVLDPLALLRLIIALEREFAGEVPLDGFDLDHFRSLERDSGLLLSTGVLEAGGTS